MSRKVLLYNNLPEIYRQLDAKKLGQYKRLPDIYQKKLMQSPTQFQLRAYLGVLSEMFNKIYENIENLYHNLFIESCEPWVIPYIGDLLGISHLRMDPWNLRANVADNIKLLRKKGTLSAIEELTFDITKWGVYCRELKDKLLFNQNLNFFNVLLRENNSSEIHNSFKQHTTNHILSIRDPALLSLMETPFDPFGHLTDLKPLIYNNLRYNIPNLAIFLWRLETFQVLAMSPGEKRGNLSEINGGYLVGFNFHPLNRPVRLFNVSKRWTSIKSLTQDKITLEKLIEIDETPGKILRARLNEKSVSGNPSKYLKVIIYDNESQLKQQEVGITIYIPSHSDWDDWPSNKEKNWVIRGEDLSEWEKCIRPSLENGEIAIDPKIGRVLFRVDSSPKADLLIKKIRLNYTYGFSGDIGANPAVRQIPEEWRDKDVEKHRISGGKRKLNSLISRIQDNKERNMIIIEDSQIYTLSSTNIILNNSLYIRADDHQRPIIKLSKSFEFSQINNVESNVDNIIDAPDESLDTGDGLTNDEEDEVESEIDTIINENQNKVVDVKTPKGLKVRLEGLFITRSTRLSKKKPLIARVALDLLEIVNCTLDPGGHKLFENDDSRETNVPSLELSKDYGYSKTEKASFKEIPIIIFENCISGTISMEDDYSLYLKNTIFDAGKGVREEEERRRKKKKEEMEKKKEEEEMEVMYAIEAPKCSTIIDGVTIFGRTLVKTICGKGGIFVLPLEVRDTMKGCLQYSYIAGARKNLPQIEKCVHATTASPKLQFISDKFGEHGYGQLDYKIDSRIKENGPNNNPMGAFGFLCESDKWRNLILRFREFMPVGIKPIFIVKT